MKYNYEECKTLEIPEIKIIDQKYGTLKDIWILLLEDFSCFESDSNSLIFIEKFGYLMNLMKLNRENQQIIQYLQIIVDCYIEFFSANINNPNIYPSMYRFFSYLPIQTTFLLFRNIKTGKITYENQTLFKNGLSECDFITMTDCEKLQQIMNKI